MDRLEFDSWPLLAGWVAGWLSGGFSASRSLICREGMLPLYHRGSMRIKWDKIVVTSRHSGVDRQTWGGSLPLLLTNPLSLFICHKRRRAPPVTHLLGTLRKFMQEKR